MNKFFKLGLLLCTLLASIVLSGSAALAAITGMIGVGTWRTQAEFADIKVTRAGTTLYQSNFATGMSEWQIKSGTWQTQNGVLTQTGNDMPAMVLTGDPTWSNYTVTLRARKISGAEGFLITFGSPGDNTTTQWNIGGWDNTLSAIQAPGISVPSIPLALQTGQWYDIKIELVGDDIRCYLNGALIHDTTPKPIKGMVGVGTWRTQAEFADVKVARNGTTLYQSNFTNGMNEWQVKSGTWQTTTEGTLRQTANSEPAFALIGDPAWTDYTITLRARKISGAEGFLISFGSPGDNTTTQWNIAGWDNTRSTIQAPGIYTPDVYGGVQTGRWYNIRIQVQDCDIRCYLDGVLVHDTRNMFSASDRARRFKKIMSSPGYAMLNPVEQQRIQNLAGRDVYIGQAARSTFVGMGSNLTFDQMTPSRQANVLRDIANHQMLTWNTGWGFGGNEPWRDSDIINSMDGAVMQYNRYGMFDMQLTANNSPGTPTADASYGGYMRFGGSRNYRVALHETSHTQGTGTHWKWGQFMVNGRWTGTYANLLIKQFDGPNASLWGDGAHYWPYGLNQDGEYSDLNAYREVLLVGAMQRDMGIAPISPIAITNEVPSGVYHLMPRHAPNSALEVTNADPSQGAKLNIRTYAGTTNQRFLLDLQKDGSYRIRTALAGNRCLELPGGDTNNGVMLQLADDNNSDAQRWYLVAAGDGTYKLAPKNNIYKSVDVSGVSTTDGAVVHNWDYFDAFNQQWNLVLESVPVPSAGMLTPSSVVAGSTATNVTITGTGFIPASTVRWNNVERPTTFVSATELTVALTDADLATAGTANVTVVSPAPGGGASNALLFAIQGNPGTPNLMVTGATVQRQSGNLLVDVTLTNQGTAGATVAQLLRTCTLGSAAATSLPPTVTTIAANGGSATVRIVFPDTAGSTGSRVTLMINGKCDQGNFTGSRRITVP